MINKDEMDKARDNFMKIAHERHVDSIMKAIDDIFEPSRLEKDFEVYGMDYRAYVMFDIIECLVIKAKEAAIAESCEELVEHIDVTCLFGTDARFYWVTEQFGAYYAGRDEHGSVMFHTDQKLLFRDEESAKVYGYPVRVVCSL